MKTLKSTSSVLCSATVLLAIGHAWAYQDYPQDVGDLVYRDCDGQIYGRDGVSPSMAIYHPGHVGIYVGNGEVVEALATTEIIIVPVGGEVMLTPLAASPGVHSFYADWSDAGTYDGNEQHHHMGAKTHNALLNNANALTLRQNIKMLALNQVGEGYDNNFSAQKGPGNDQWTCVGLGEAVYEWCAGQTLPNQYPSYGDQSQYAGGLNITPDGYEYHFWDVIPYYQNNVEFSQIPTYALLAGRWFGLELYIFFPYTQFEQPTLIDAFPPPATPGPTITSVTPRTLDAVPLGQTHPITITGSGFTSSSRLTFNDGVNPPYTDKVPASWTPTQLTYNIAVGPNPATWTVKVVNNGVESLPYSFYVVSGTKELTGLSVSGPATINENTSGQFNATAYYSDGSSSAVTPIWSINGSVATISASGQVNASGVSANTAVTVSASYSAGGITKPAIANLTIVNTGTGTTYHQQQLIVNGSFASGGSSWTLTGAFQADSRFSVCRSCPGYAYLANADGSAGNNLNGVLSQTFTIPANAIEVAMDYWHRTTTTETGGNIDRLNVRLRLSPTTVVGLDDIWNGNANTAYAQRSIDLIAYKGLTVTLEFAGTTSASFPTTFRVDDVSVLVTVPDPPTPVSLAISGPSSVPEGGTGQYYATMIYSDGSTQPATALSWGNNTPSLVTFTSGGLLTAGQVSQGTGVSIWTTATVAGQSYQAFKDITVVNQAATFSYLAISGPSSINENSSGQFSGTAIFSDGSSQSVSPSWSENSTATSISSGGSLTAGEVSANTTVTVSASYTIGGVTRNANQDVLIVNIPPPVMLSALSISGPSSVGENSTASFSATASFSDGSLQVVSPTWSVDSVAASISIFGLLSAGEVASDTSVTVSAGYTTGGITRNAQKSVTVINTTTSIISLNGDLVFGNVVTNTTATRTLTITNSGNSALNVSSMSYPSGFSGAWSGVIAAGGSTNVTVTFAPTALTTYSGTVAVNSDATSGLSTIAASGRGVVAPTRIISLSGDLAFGNVVVGQTATRTLTIASSGNLALNVSSISYPSGFSGAWSGSIAANGSHNVTVTFAPTAVTNYNGTVTVNSDMTSGVSTITASGTGTVALPGSVVAWGDNTYGQCNVPRGLTNVVASGFHHSLALKADGTVVGWGENDFGQTNPPAGLSNVAAIAAGWGTSLALKRDGTLEEWGWDGGYGLTTTAESLTNIKAIAACWDCFMALRNDNTVFVWGKSTHGETNVPAALNGVTAIAGGGWFCMALKGDGTVVTWGSNQFGQTNTPANLSGVKAIAAGGDHCLALQSDGTVVAWGYNYYGQTDVPPDLTDALSVSAGAYHSLALRADGTLVAWGLGSSGQTNIPTGLHGVTAISAGGFHNLALVAGSYPMQLSGVNCLPGGQVQFAVSGLAGDVYRVLGSTNLRDWQTIAWVTNLSGTMQFTDPGATGYNRRFYRLVMP